MRVDNVDPVKGIGFIKFNTDTEIDLVAESMDRLIKKQKKIADKAGNRTDTAAELEKLERFKKSKDAIAEIPKENKRKLRQMRYTVTKEIRLRAMSELLGNEKDEEKRKMIETKVIKDKSLNIEDTPEFQKMNKVVRNAEYGSGLREGTEVTHRNMHVLVNALNEHICDMEKDGLYKKTRRNEQKYEKLKQMLANAQEQKSHFERVRPKPRGFGRLRK
jgi:hypothetical protein